MPDRTKVAIIGSGNIGTDLMIKILRLSETLEVVAMVGIDAASDGLARANRMGVQAVSTGVQGLLELPVSSEIEIVFDATSAGAHLHNADALAETNAVLVDLTPAAIGPYVIPPVNLDQHIDAGNVNMVTCGGQATIPMVAAIASTGRVRYAEIVASIASRSAGPGTRANIDEFTETTRKAIEVVGGADRGKAIIILNPAEPAMIMRDTVLCIVENCDEAAVVAAVDAMQHQVAAYVPGYQLKQRVQFRRLTEQSTERDLVEDPGSAHLTVVTVFLEVTGAGHYLPAYAGNLDIMTSAALQVGERIAMRRRAAVSGGVG